MNISVEREASFEVSRRRSNFSVGREASFEVSSRKIKRNNDLEDSIIVNPAADQDQNAPKKSDTEKSPKKVTDFIEGFPDNFVTPSKVSDSRNLSADSFDPWGDEAEEDRQESEQIDFTPFDSALTSEDDATPKKILFPEETEMKENSLVVEKDEAKQKDNLDDNGFPSTSASSEMYSASVLPAEFLEEKKEKEEEEASRWQWLKQLPEGTRVKAMQIRRKILSCQGHQGASSVVVFDDGIDPSNIGDEKPKPPEGSESVFTYSSLKQFSASVFTISQDMLSMKSKAATPDVETEPEPKEQPSAIAPSMSFFEHFSFGGNESVEVLKLYIDLYEKAAFEELMSNLTGNREVKEIQVFRSWEQEGKAERTRTKEDIALLFKTIGSLPNLETLNLANFLGIDVHFVCLSEWQNQNLKNVRIHLCKGALSKRLLSVLAQLPALKDVTLEMNNSFPFHILLQSATLESLTIVENGFDVDNLHAMEVVQEISKNETLKKLTIEPPMKPRTFKLLISALGKNMGIEEFNFSLLPGADADTNRVLNELARTLGTNASLKSVHNLKYDKLEVEDERTCDALMKALSDNYIIEDFLVFDEEPWFRDRKERILKENKMEYDSMFPQVFKCGHDLPVDDGKSVGADDSTVSAAAVGLASIGDSMRSSAQRVASGALDLVGQSVGLKKQEEQ